MYTLDSNIIIGYLNGDERIAEQLFRWRTQGKTLFLSVITEIEVLSLPNLTPITQETIRRFLGTFSIVPLDSQLGHIAAAFRREKQLGLGDCVIVATAKLTNTTLVTNDKTILRRAARAVPCRSILA